MERHLYDKIQRSVKRLTADDEIAHFSLYVPNTWCKYPPTNGHEVCVFGTTTTHTIGESRQVDSETLEGQHPSAVLRIYLIAKSSHPPN